MVWFLERNKKSSGIFEGLGEFFVGDGRQVHFWEDVGSRIEPLKATFSNLYTVAASNGAFVADCWNLWG